VVKQYSLITKKTANVDYMATIKGPETRANPEGHFQQVCGIVSTAYALQAAQTTRMSHDQALHLAIKAAVQVRTATLGPSNSLPEFLRKYPTTGTTTKELAQMWELLNPPKALLIVTMEHDQVRIIPDGSMMVGNNTVGQEIIIIAARQNEWTVKERSVAVANPKDTQRRRLSLAISSRR
jgi:hypothetical protein